MSSYYARQKQLTYRDQNGKSRAEHQAHWKDFTFEGGPVIVKYEGSWGQIQVWAKDEAEGRRVIGHACAIAGIPAAGQGDGEWIVKTAKPGRNGKAGAFITATIEGLPCVTKRPGPSGFPVLSD